MSNEERLQLHGTANVSKYGRLPLTLAVSLGMTVLFIGAWQMGLLDDTRENRGTQAVAPAPVDTAEKPLLPQEAKTTGLISARPKEPEVPEVPKDTKAEEGLAPIQIVVQDPKRSQLNETGDPFAAMQQQRITELHARRTESAMAALASPLGVVRGRSGSAIEDSSASGDLGTSGSPLPGTPGLPVAITGATNSPAIEREGFLNRADRDDWLSPHTRQAGNPFELKTGTVVPGVMLTGINSDLPGSIIAQVSQHVYDSATGQQLLIPQGTRLYGVYDARVAMGQRRVLIAWNRLIFPDGSSVTLGAMPGAAHDGMAGFEDQVDNHYFRIFGNAIMMSLISGGMAYGMDSMDGSSSNSNSEKPTVQSEMGSALSAQLGQTSLNLLEKNASTSPTLRIRAGYTFNLVLTKDIAFAAPYGQLSE